MKIDVDDMIKNLAGEDPTRLAHWDLIKQHLATMDHTPDHPVYSVMIREAVTKLNDGKGSSREAISQFITERYDVLQVIHSAKLIEQLEKLVEKEEVLFTADNCYILPVEHIGSLGKLKEDKKISGRGQLVGKGNAYYKVKRGGRIKEDRNRSKEVKKQFPIEELERMPASEVACFANNGNLETEHADITKEKPQAVMKQTSEEGNLTHSHTKLSECSLDEVIDGPPGFCTEIINHENQLTKEMGDDLKGKQVKVSEEQFPWFKDRLQKVVEEEVCEPNVKKINDQRQMGRCQSVLEQNAKARELTELPGQALEVVEHQIEAAHEVDTRTSHQALQCLNVKRCAHTDQMPAQAIERQNKSLEQDFSFNKEHERLQKEDANHGTGIRGQPELSLEEDEVMITTPSSSQAELEYGGLLLSIKRLKEANMILLKNSKVMEQVLRQNMNCLSLLEASILRLPQPTAGEHMMVPQSKPSPLSHSKFVSTDKVQYLLNQQKEMPSLKRARELLITTLDETDYQRKLVKTWHLKSGPNFGTSSVQVDLKQLELEHPRDQSKFESRKELCEIQKPGESCLMLPSPEAALDLHRLDLVQQTDQCIDVDHTRQEQPSCLTKRETTLEKSALIAKQELTAVADISTVMRQLKHDGLLDGQSKTDSSLHSWSLVEDGSAGLEKMDEQLPLEQPKQFEISVKNTIQNCKLTMPSQFEQSGQQPTLLDKREMHQTEIERGDQHKIALHEGPVDCEMTTVDKNCPAELQIQGNMFLSLEQTTSTSVPGPTTCTCNDQPEVIEVSQEETQRIVSESSQALEKQEKSSNLEFRPKRRRPIRQLRPRKAKPSASDESCIAVGNDLGLVLSILKSEKKKAGPSESASMASSGEVKILEYPGQVKPARSGDLSESQQQQPPHPQVLCCSVVDDLKEPLHSPNEQEQHDEPRHQGQRGPADIGCATPDLIEKDMTDHQSQFKTSQKKRGRGRPCKFTDSSDKNVNLFFRQHHSKQVVLQSPVPCEGYSSKTKPAMAVTGVTSSTSDQQPQKSLERRITRAGAAANEASTVLALPATRQHRTLQCHGKEKFSKRKIDSMENPPSPKQDQPLLKFQRQGKY